jgi:hypothetical protein
MPTEFLITLYMEAADRPKMTVWRIRFECWIPMATNTRSEYVIFFLPHCNNGYVIRTLLVWFNATEEMC